MLWINLEYPPRRRVNKNYCTTCIVVQLLFKVYKKDGRFDWHYISCCLDLLFCRFFRGWSIKFRQSLYLEQKIRNSQVDSCVGQDKKCAAWNKWAERNTHLFVFSLCIKMCLPEVLYLSIINLIKIILIFVNPLLPLPLDLLVDCIQMHTTIICLFLNRQPKYFWWWQNLLK